MTTRVKLNSSGLVKVTDDGTETVIIDVTETYVTSDNTSSATSTATSATTIADSASTSASNAKTAADSASTSASNATTAADAASTSALAASNLIATRNYNGTNTTISAVPSETLMIIVYNTGGKMDLTGSAATVKLVYEKVADEVNSNNTIEIPEESTTILIREKANVFRFLFSVTDGAYQVQVYR